MVPKSINVIAHNAQDEERAVCDCLNPFDVIAVELARHLFFGALPILGDVAEVRGDIARHHQWAGEMGLCKWQVNIKTGRKLKTP